MAIGLWVLSACGGGAGTPDDQGVADVATDHGSPGDVGDSVDTSPADSGFEVPPRDIGADESPVDVDPGDTGPDWGDDGGDSDAPGIDSDVCDDPSCLPCPDDGLICTDVVRDEFGECVPVIRQNFCLIQGACYFAFQPSLDFQCIFCMPDVDNTKFSPFAGQPCDDSDPCTSGDTCNEQGSCSPGGPTDCNDGNPCTIGRCTKGIGCTQIPTDSVCDDGSECTYQDYCLQGKCVGTPVTCNDSNPCTDNRCDPFRPGGCHYPFNSNPCTDYNTCTENDRCVEGVCTGTQIDCDDGDPCTNDSCIAGVAGGCRNVQHFGACDDGNKCTVNNFCDGTGTCVGSVRVCNDLNPCTDDSCDPDVGCVFAFNENPCSAAGDACTLNERCFEGACIGDQKDCEDGNLCTRNWCDPVMGCRQEIIMGFCDDGNACTVNERCDYPVSVGVCVAPAGSEYRLDCDDRNPCTVDNCDPKVGCVHTPQGGVCQDSDPCSLTGMGFCEAGVCISIKKDCDDNNPCTANSCGPSGECVYEPLLEGASCSTGNFCVEGEKCISGQCQGGSTRNCSDNNSCTIDTCDVAQGCLYTPTTGAACNDNSKCSINDKCLNGVCTGDAVICEDHNLCTENTCVPAVGCVFVPNDLPCNDNNPCTIDDQCSLGACVGQSLFTYPSNKAGKLSFGISGNPGQGVDVDDNEATCMPKGYCVTGIDNAFAVLSWMFNPEMIKATSAGNLALLLEPEDLVLGGDLYETNLFWGERVAPAACDPATPGCNYSVYSSYLMGVCDPRYTFTNTRIEGTRLMAGGRDYTMPIYLVFGTARVALNLRWAKIVAQVSITDGYVASGSGAMGGWVPRQEIIAAVASIPEFQFPPPYIKETVLQYLDIYLLPDMDPDGDGVKDAVSIGMPFTLVTGRIIGPL